MRKQLMVPALLALSVGLAACATPPNPSLEQARTNFSALQANPQSSQVAALETKDASDWLDKADAAYRNNEDTKKVDQLSYLTIQRVELAKQTINLRTAEEQLKNAEAMRAQARLAARDAQIKKLQDSLNAKQTERGTLVTFGDVLFDFNKAELKSSGMMDVNKLAQFLQENPDRQVIVEGYTDSSGSASYNQSLSERRANSVRTALVKMGVDSTRVVAQGYGKEYPASDNSSNSGRAQNRRVEVTISNDNQPVAPRSSMQSTN
jgi:outer membrane protein OmpA-like peptidoglycan-associated protein